jgi:hypothetical protein
MGSAYGAIFMVIICFYKCFAPMGQPVWLVKSRQRFELPPTKMIDALRIAS